MSKIAPQIDLPSPILVQDSTTPLHRQIYDYIHTAVVTGQLKPRTRLPDTRQLVIDWGISRNVLLAFEQLLLEGYWVAKTGAGTFAADDPLPPPSDFRIATLRLLNKVSVFRLKLSVSGQPSQ